jgi:hypothetical protein
MKKFLNIYHLPPTYLIEGQVKLLISRYLSPKHSQEFTNNYVKCPNFAILPNLKVLQLKI